jgi:hypothetical protein
MKTGKFCKEQVYLVTVRPESASYRYHEDFIEIDRKFQLCLIEQLKKSGVYHTYKRAVYISAVNGFWMIVMKRIYSPLNKESGRQKYMLLKTVRKDKIYKTAFEKITCKEIYEDSRFPIKQKGVLFLIKIRGIAAAHGFILLWTRTRDGKR